MAKPVKPVKMIWFGEAVNKVAKEAILGVVKTGCHMVEADAKIECPVDFGILRASLTNEIDESKQEGKVGTNKIYSPYVEFGTGIHAEGGKGRKIPWVYKDKKGWHFTHGNKPQPYLRPAFEKNRKIIEAMFKKLVK